MSKDTARQEVEQVCFAYEKAGKTGNKKDWGEFYDLEDSLIKKVEVANQPKLSIPKKIAEQADKTDFDELFQWGKEEFYQWFDHEHDEYKEIIYAYLAGKALGVELVEVSDE